MSGDQVEHGMCERNAEDDLLGNRDHVRTKEIRYNIGQHNPWSQLPGWCRNYLDIHILSIADLLGAAEDAMLPPFGTFKQAGKMDAVGADQHALDV
jgi:hypothetical protein